jgi:hypothetical protein
VSLSLFTTHVSEAVAQKTVSMMVSAEMIVFLFMV